MLFADVKGSMELGEKVDPEEWYRIMDRFFQILSDGVHRFEGTVDKFTGDGIMAIFGAPIAHEDHARRACYAALHLRDELRRYAEELKRTRGLSFSVRMGLNSGEVVVGTIGDDLKMVYTAHGNTVGLGQRMEQLATPDQVYLTEHSAKLVSGFFRLRDLGPFELKGVSAPVRVYELEGVGALHTPLEVSRSRGFSRFVGRQDEMAALEAALARAIGGSAQVVGIVGEPGRREEPTLLRVSRALPGTRARDLRGARRSAREGASAAADARALPELLRHHGPGLRPGRAREDRRQICASRREPARGSPPDLRSPRRFRSGAPRSADGPREPPAPARGRWSSASTQMWGRRQPAVTFLEDLHWFDGGSEGFLEPIVEALPGTQMARAGELPPRVPRRVDAEVLLPAASAAAARAGGDRGAAARSSRRRSFTRRARQSHSRAHGREPVLHRGGGAGAGRDREPRGSEGSVPAGAPCGRADAFPPRSRPCSPLASIGSQSGRSRCSQTAAVIGREFTEPILRRVVELPEIDLAAALQKLTSAEFIYEEALYPQAQYTFKHALTQEVAYNSLLERTAPDAPRARGEAIEAIFARSPRGALERACPSLQPQSEHREGDRVFATCRRARRAAVGERGGDQSSDDGSQSCSRRCRTVPSASSRSSPCRSPWAVPLLSHQGILRRPKWSTVRPGSRALPASGRDTRLFPVLRGLVGFHELRAESQDSTGAGEAAARPGRSGSRSVLSLSSATMCTGRHALLAGRLCSGSRAPGAGNRTLRSEQHRSHAFVYGLGLRGGLPVLRGLALFGFLATRIRLCAESEEALSAGPRARSPLQPRLRARVCAASLHQLRREPQLARSRPRTRCCALDRAGLSLLVGGGHWSCEAGRWPARAGTRGNRADPGRPGRLPRPEGRSWDWP